MIPIQAIGRGAGRLAFVEVAGFAVDETRYPGGLELVPHRHERASLCFVLEGGLTERIGRGERECGAATLIVKPRDEVHSDRFHAGGARCLNIVVDHERLAALHGAFPALDEVQFEEDPALAVPGQRIALELGRTDDLTPLVVEGLVLELIGGTLRSARLRRARASASPWLEEARALLHARFAGRVALSEVAAAVGRHPVHVAQRFRQRFGLSIGAYVRRLRVEHVARRLAAGGEPLARLAAEAGFADQSHMQRVFKACLGVTPTAYRRARRRGR